MRTRTALIGLVAAVAIQGTAGGRPKDPERDPNPPATLNEALDRLARKLSAATIREMSNGSESDMVKYHFSVGLWMRNYWSLGAEGPLPSQLRALGLWHPDDMSGLILTCFWRRLHGKPLGVEEQVAEYQEYWRLSGRPDPHSNGACESAIETIMSFEWKAPTDSLRWVRIGTCCADGTFWAYHVDRGWYRPTAAELAIVRDLAAANQDLAGYAPCKE